MYKNYGVYDDRPIDYTKTKTKKQKEKIKRSEHKIKILDKITTKVETFEIKVNDSINFNSLFIEIY